MPLEGPKQGEVPARFPEARPHTGGYHRHLHWGRAPRQPLTLKMRGRSRDWAWITSEARTGVAENWGSLGNATKWVRGRTATGCSPTLSQWPAPCPHTTAPYPPQIQGLQQGPAGRAQPRVGRIEEQQARVAERGKHPLPATPHARGPGHLCERQAWEEGPPHLWLLPTPHPL